MPESYHPSIEALGPSGKAVVDLFYGEAQGTFRLYGFGKADITADGQFGDYGLEYTHILCALASVESLFSMEIPEGLWSISGISRYLNLKHDPNAPEA